MTDGSPRVLSRREWFGWAAGVAAVAAGSELMRAQTRAGAPTAAPAAKPALQVYKDPSCGCCQSWVDYMQKNGYKATVIPTPNMDRIKEEHKIPASLQSCHTTIVGGYVIEGHVPVDDIARLLAEKPKGVIGLTIPGMPQSAPGMDVTPFQPYTVLSFDAAGKTTTYARHTKA